MEGGVKTVGSFLARGDVVPTIAETDAVAVDQIEVESQLSIGAGEEFAKRLFVAKQDVRGSRVDGRVANIRIVRAQRHTMQGQIQLEIGGHPRMVLGFVESEIVLHHARCTDVAKQRDASGGILQFWESLDVKHTLQGATNPQTQTVVVGLVDPVENLGGKVKVDHGTSRLSGRILKQMESGTHMVTAPFDRDASTSIHAVAKIAEGNSTIVVAIRDIQA